MTIPLVDLSAQYQPLKAEILQNIEKILDSMQLFLGPNVQAFEKEFAAYQNVDHAIGVSDGTSALQLALLASGVGPGDQVITPSHTFIATCEAIALIGAEPIFIDVDPRTLTIDVNQLEALVTPKTRAIVPVHLYGQPADMDPILALAEQRGLTVIEDACQAHGARYNGRRTGGLGRVAAFSFYFSKNLGAYGEAGMVTTNDESIANKIRMLRDHGSETRYHHDLVGANARLDEIQAAVLRVKLPHLDGWNRQRRASADHYTQLMQDMDNVIPPFQAHYAQHVYHLYVIRAPQRDKLRQFLWDRYQIGTGVHYPIPCHLQPAFTSANQSRHPGLPVTEKIAGEILSLPMYPELTAEQRIQVVDAIREFYKTTS